MLVRTISQLPRVESDFSNGLIEISIPEGNQATSKVFSSKSVREGDIESRVSSTTDTIMAEKYHLLDDTSPIDVNSVRATVNSISSEAFAFNGVKRFNQWPYIPHLANDFPTDDTQYNRNLDYVVPNVSKVNDLICSQPIYFSSTSSYVAEGNPLNQHSSINTDSSVPESLMYDTTVREGKFYYWRIDQNDSSKSIYDTRSRTSDGYEQMRNTGNLVMWGWLADNGDVSPEMAWVGLFAAIKCIDGNTTHTIDVPIAIHPWICGSYSSTLQYVGFTVPVKEGLKLKVKTGFTVNNMNSGFQQKGTLTFVDRWVPNSFFGYIVV